MYEEYWALQSEIEDIINDENLDQQVNLSIAVQEKIAEYLAAYEALF